MTPSEFQEIFGRCLRDGFKEYVGTLIDRSYKAGYEKAKSEIVHCKDCKYASPNGNYGCTVYHFKRYETHEMKPDDFCSWAERKEE